MHYSTTILSAFALLPFAVAEGDYVLKLYKDEGCDGDDTLELHTFESTSDSCQFGTVIPTDDWERNDQEWFKAYLDADGLAANCKIAFIQQSSTEPDKCGISFLTIDGALERTCKSTFFPENLGTYYCCDEQCDELNLRSVETELSGRGMTPAQKAKKSLPTTQATPPGTAPAARDVTALKKTSLGRRDECTWDGGAPEDKRASAPQKVTSTLSCSNGEDCTLTDSVEVGFSATDTFGISSEVGASFFDIVQASISFSYDYSYTSDESRTVQYSVTQPANTKGYLTFTPFYECTTGLFHGDCSDWKAEEHGDVCIPKTLAGGQPDGEVTFVQEF